MNALLPDTELDVTFGIVTIGGHAGCNTFSGTYGTNGDIVRVSQLATTRLACEQPVMDQETAFLAALQGVARIDSLGHAAQPRGPRRERPRPARAAVGRRARGQPLARCGRIGEPEAEPSASRDAKPTPTPTAKPTPTPTAEAHGHADREAHRRPDGHRGPGADAHAPDPASFPPTARATSCRAAGGAAVANLVYPGSWFTLAEPPELACRYFDPAEIVVPADPATLDTAVRADLDATPFADAVAAASDPANWTVAASSSFDVGGAPVTCVTATAAAEGAGIPVGEARQACFADVKAAGHRRHLGPRHAGRGIRGRGGRRDADDVPVDVRRRPA